MVVEIYRMDANNQAHSTLSAAGKTITFDDTVDINNKPDNLMSLMTSQHIMERTRTNNPAPGQEEARKPDTGFGGITYTYNVYFEPGATAIQRLREWFTEKSIVRSSNPLPHGRFGVRDTDHPEFDVHPAAGHGLKLTSFTLDFVGNSFKRNGRIILEFSGDASMIGDVSGR